jgi:hypothetical protein
MELLDGATNESAPVNKYQEFLKAYDNIASQDNEGFIPDRAGFKLGFSAAWEIQQVEVERLKTVGAKFVVENAFKNSDLRKDNDKLKSLLRECRETLEWYADGIYPGDESEVKPGELRAGKRARAMLTKLEEALRD